MQMPEKREAYHSNSPPKGWLGKAFPSLAFYRRVVPVVFRASSCAKRGRYSDARWAWDSMQIVHALQVCGVPMAVENIGVFSRLEGPCIIVGNHMSTAETFMLAAFIAPHREVTFVVKRQLVDYPVFKHIMRARNPVVVGRQNPRDDLRVVMTEGAARLKAGVSVIVFPQRTRTRTFDPADFNTIGVKLARRGGVPVVPLALKTDAWTNGRLIKDFGPLRPDRPLHLAFGEPLSTDVSDRETNDAVIEFIRSKLKAWGGDVRQPQAP